MELLSQIYSDLECEDEYMKNILNDDFNISINIHLLNKMIIFMNKGVYIKPTKITDSSGSVIILIFNEFVIKLFKRESVLNNVINIITNNSSPYIVYLKTFINKNISTNVKNIEEKPFYAICTNKLTPIIKNTQEKAILMVDLNNDLSILKLLFEILDALYYMHNDGYCHNDCTLDNIGIVDNNFTLFDFNISSISINTKSDILSFIRSIKFNISQNIKDEDLNENVSILFEYLDKINKCISYTTDLIYYITLYYNIHYKKNKGEYLSELEFFNMIRKHTIHFIK